ncbi:MAG: SDR family NAD(P)-dependent oxidoreductase [Lentimonas sp.]
MDIAIVTGAETPLGLRIIEGLILQGCRVHGIGNNLSKVTYADRNFIAHAIDVSDLSAVQQTTTEILEKEGALHILIHAIDVTPGAVFENLPVGNLEAILKVGLLGPVILTRLALPNLLRYRGQLINIIPANKSGHAVSAVNSLIEGGLREMNNALFDQARDAGLRVTNLILRQNTELPAATISDEHLDQTRIDPDQVARTIDYLLNANESNVPNEITLHPRLSNVSKEALPEAPIPIDPYNSIVLPPAEYCPPKQSKIPTRQPDQIERTIPFSDEEMEEKIAAAIEEFEIHPERYEPNKNGPQQPKRNKQKFNQEREGESKPRRGRRRGSRNRKRDDKDSSQQPRNAEGESQNTPSEKSTIAKPKQTHSDLENTSNKPNRNDRRRRGGRKPDQSKDRTSNETPKEHNKQTSVPKQPEPESKRPKPEPKSKVTRPKPKPKTADKHKTPSKPKPVAKKAVKKKAAKKAAKKVAAKKATKKAAKKAVKKKAVKKAK